MRAPVLQDVSLPEGRVIKKFKGGPDALNKVVDLLRKRGFSGYLKVTTDGDSSLGYVVMGKGKQVVALSFGPEGTHIGEDALPHFKEMAASKDYNIELHTDVDVDAILKKLPKAPEEAKKAVGSGKGEGKRRLSLEALSQSLANVIDAFADRGKEGKTPPKEEASPQDKAPKPTTRKRAKKAAKEKDSKKPPKEKRPRKSRKKKEVKEEPDNAPELIEEVTEEPEPPQEVPKKVLIRPPTPSVDPETGLTDFMTFESYLTGDSNRFARASCQSLAEGALGSLPLFLVADSGMGKTHLLNATGWALLEANPKIHLRYLTGGKFRKEIEEAEKDGRMAEYLQTLQELGALLLDDLQDLGGSTVAQGALFDLFEKFHTEGKPLILAADRNPGEIDGLDSRLASRLQSGLVAVLKPADVWMRLDFLKSQVRMKGVSCPAPVLRYLAESKVPDLRGLEGALNTVLAYANTMQRGVDLDLAREAAGEILHSDEHVKLPRVDLLPSRSYLVEDENTDAAFRLFAERAKGVKALMVTRMNPSRVRGRVDTGADILWLTDRPDSSESTVEPVLERLAHTFEGLIAEGGAGVLMLDGVEYLKSNNGFEPVLRFIRHLVDEVSESHFTLVFALDPATLEPREIRVLEREMEVIRLPTLSEDSGVQVDRETE